MNEFERVRRRIMFGSAAVREWTNWELTGYLCNSAGTTDAYDCDGTYSVYYYQEARYYQFPNGTGRIDTEYRSNGVVATREECSGQCGYNLPRTRLDYIGFAPDTNRDWRVCYLEAYTTGRQYTGTIWMGNSSYEWYTSEFGDEHAPVGYYLITDRGTWDSSYYQRTYYF